jgi:hypothetical protein
MATRTDRAMADWAAFYRARGFNPLPSRPDAKRPYIKYADLWETTAPADCWERWPEANIQVMTGRHWGLLAIDLDGPEAIERWNWRRTPLTWITHSGGGGQHLWFRVPKEHPKPLPKAFLWRGEGKHQAIERLCDHSLIMAPPSIHPTSGRTYRFLDLAHSPKRIALPAPVPGWVLSLPPVAAPAAAGAPSPRRSAASAPAFVGDRVAEARRWGLKIAGPARSSGWIPCHAIGREDRTPSAAIHEESGYYVDLGSGARLRFRELLAELGAC